jgi:ubiquinone biosynthesis UbiH/UbiF/VisC/COQ6 family hydroxylase
MQVDIAIVGAGPAGLCFARTLKHRGLSVLLIEQQSLASLRDPPFDGREIALTQRSVRILHELGIWQRLGPADVSLLRSARVLNGQSRHGLRVSPNSEAEDALGYLVPNHRIRRAAYASIEHEPTITFACDTSVEAVTLGDDAARLRLSNGSEVTAKLVVAADSRYSRVRRDVGIAADMHDFGKTMLVCRMALERPHRDEALEWFGHHQTLAALPLNNAEASIVLTLPPHDIQGVMAMDDKAFQADMRRRFDERFGEMRLTSTRHAYPLVGVYARRFMAQRLALIGDAAVGMHPVTAHGFNLGLRSVETLGGLVAQAAANGSDIASADLLRRYQGRHRRATWPLYAATTGIVAIYTNEGPAARLTRTALLRASQALPPVRRAIAHALTAGHPVAAELRRHRS